MQETMSDTISREFLFFCIFIIIILSWVSIDLIGRFINNFTFGTLGLDDKSTFHLFEILLCMDYFKCEKFNL